MYEQKKILPLVLCALHTLRFVVRYHGVSWSGVLMVRILLLAGASKKIQSMTFSTEHRAELLTDALVSIHFTMLSSCKKQG